MQREKYSPAKDYSAEKEGYSENGREHTTVCDRTIEEQGSPFYAHEPKPDGTGFMEQKLGAQNEPQGSLLNASDRAGQTGGPGFMPVSRNLDEKKPAF